MAVWSLLTYPKNRFGGGKNSLHILLAPPKPFIFFANATSSPLNNASGPYVLQLGIFFFIGLRDDEYHEELCEDSRRSIDYMKIVQLQTINRLHRHF